MKKKMPPLPERPPHPGSHPTVLDREYVPVSADTARRMQTGRTTRERIRAVDEVLQSPRHRTSEGMRGSGVPLDRDLPSGWTRTASKSSKK